MDAAGLLAEIRDGWLESVRAGRLVPGRFLESGDIERLSASTGWTGRHLAEAVRRAFSPFDDESLKAMCEPGNGPGPRRDMLAIVAGRVPALAAKVVFHGIAAGMNVVLKPSAAEPVFSGLLARSFAAAGYGHALSVARDNREELAPVIAGAPVCIVYGSDATVNEIMRMREGLPTLTGPHMESLAVVFASALDSIERAAAVAEAIAADTAIYDQGGCLSPVAVLVQEGGAVGPARFAEILLNSILASRLEPGCATVEAVAAVRMFERESSLIHGNDAVIRNSLGVPPLVVVCGNVRPGPGLRTLQVAPFAGSPVLADLVPHLRGRVQGMAVAGTPSEAATMFSSNPDFTPNYACAPGQLQDPPALWRENGIVLCDELRKLT